MIEDDYKKTPVNFFVKKFIIFFTCRPRMSGVGLDSGDHFPNLVVRGSQA